MAQAAKASSLTAGARTEPSIPSASRIACSGVSPGVEQSGVAHRAVDAARPADDLRVASRRAQDAEDAGVEHRHHLGEPGGDCDFSDTRQQLAERQVDPVAGALRLALDGDRADTGNFPDRAAFDEFSVMEQEGKYVAKHVRPGCRQQPQRSPVLARLRINRDQIKRVLVVEGVAFVSVLYLYLHPSRSEKIIALLRNIASISRGNNDERFPSITFNTVTSPLH